MLMNDNPKLDLSALFSINHPADRPAYRKWMRFYVDFCQKHRYSPHFRSSLAPFLAKLASKNQSMQSQRQASHAVRLLLDSGTPVAAEAAPVPAPKHAATAERPPERTLIVANREKNCSARILAV